MILKMLSIILLFGCSLISLRTEALTCKKTIVFVVQCRNSICVEGFFDHRRFAGSWCETLTDVDEKTYRFDGNLGLFVSQRESLNGFYAIEAWEMGYSGRDFKHLQCFDLDENGIVHLKCKDDRIKVTKLQYSDSSTISSVVQDFVSRSRNEALINQLLQWSFPSVLLVLLVFAIKRFRKPHSGKLVLIIFLLSLFGISQVPWGRGTWALSGLVGIAYSLFWIIAKLIDRLRSKKKSDT